MPKRKIYEYLYPMHAIITRNLVKIADLCKKHHIKELYVFGSATNDSFGAKSDVDLLYEFDYGDFDLRKQPFETIPFDPFIEYNQLKTSLEALFKTTVDLIPNQQFQNPVFRKAVDQSKTLIYGRKRLQEIPA